MSQTHLQAIRVAMLAALLPFAGASATDVTERKVGHTDPRTGYDAPGFETRTVRISTPPGAPLDLAALAATPPLGLPPLVDLPLAEHIELGRRLFFDRRLSANETLSCGMCHVPEQAFTQNELATPVGIEGRFVRRNAPALYNVAYRQRLFHDGRETLLTEQIFSPLLAENEMGNLSRDAVLTKIRSLPEYGGDFDRLFFDGLTEESLGRVLAAYQSALLSADSPFDRWFYGGDPAATGESAKAGFFLFVASGCSGCHTFSNEYAHFTDDGLHRTGVEYASRAREASPPAELQVAPGVIVPLTVSVPAPARHDLGMEEVTGKPEDRFRYRTPSLRNVALTAPYMHDGSLTTLEAVVAFYDSGSGGDPDRDPRLQPLGLSRDEKQALVAFLGSLTGANVDALASDARSAPIGERSAAGERSTAEEESVDEG